MNILLKTLYFPVLTGILVSAWGSRNPKKKLKKQALVKFKVGSDSCEQIFIVAPQLTIEVIPGATFVSDYDVILDFGEKYRKMKQDEVIRHHEFFYNTVPNTGNEIKLIAKLDQLTQQAQKIIVRNRQVSKSNVCFQCTNKMKPHSADDTLFSVYSVTEEKIHSNA